LKKPEQSLQRFASLLHDMEIKDRAEASVGSGLIEDIIFMWEESDKIRVLLKNQQNIDVVWFLFACHQTACQQHALHPPTRPHFLNKLMHGGQQPRLSIRPLKPLIARFNLFKICLVNPRW
jgi:hypothetical protein